MLLVRVGDFYEAFGHDAVMLVEHSGLNPMGGDDLRPGVARAGCPHQNIHATLRNLTDAGLSVVVCEEATQGLAVKRLKKPKERYVAQAVTPSSPLYACRLVEQDLDGGLQQSHEPPTIGIAASSRGFTLLEANPELREVQVHVGLSEEAASTLMAASRASDLYVHTSVRDLRRRPLGAGSAKGLELFASYRCHSFGAAGDVVEAGGADWAATANVAGSPVLEFVQRLCAGLGMPAPTIRLDLARPSDGERSNPSKGCRPFSRDPAVWHLVIPDQVRRPRPIPVSAAVQLGVIKSPGIPSLGEALLATGVGAAPAACRHWLESLLLVPPPYDIARSISRALQAIEQLPKTPLCLPMSAPRVCCLLSKREANAICFRDIRTMLLHTAHALQTCPEISNDVLQVVLAESSQGPATGLLGAQLRAACLDVARKISDVVVCSDSSRPAELRAAGSMRPPTRTDQYSDFRSNRPSSVPGLSADDHTKISECFKRCEGWRGRVTGAAAAPLYNAVDLAALKLQKTIAQDFGPILSFAAIVGRDATHPNSALCRQLKLVYDIRDSALWLAGDAEKVNGLRRAACEALLNASDPDCTDELIDIEQSGTVSGCDPVTSQYHASLQTIGGPAVSFLIPRDRFNRRVSGRFSTAAVEAAAEEYRLACEAAQDGIADILRELARDIADNFMHYTLMAANFSLVFRTLVEHSRSARARGWALPQLTATSKAADELHGSGSLDDLPHSSFRNPLNLRGIWPYWEDGASAVTNSLKLERMAILSGPNMGGKSTIARTVASVALLAHCGLYAPCVSAAVPELDGFFVRMAGSDAPAEGRSSFAMEMLDLQSLLLGATSQTLVVLDEIGRGTEARAGTAISAAVLENLASRKCVGLFATHLHGLLDLDWSGHSIDRLSMGTAQDPNGQLVPTHRLNVGCDSRESLAFVVAARSGLPDRLVRRAEHYFDLFGEYSQNGIRSERKTTGGDPIRKVPVPQSADAHRPSAPSVIAKTDRAIQYSSCQFDSMHLFAAMEAIMDCAVNEQDAINKGSLVVLEPTELPSTLEGNQTVVYAMLSTDGVVRIGESDDWFSRLATHRAVRRWRSATVLYAVVREGKSEARRIETALHHGLRARGWSLHGESDAAHVAFGRAHKPMA